MKIQDSSVQLTASHEESYSRSSEITSTTSFRQIFADLAQPANDEMHPGKYAQRFLQAVPPSTSASYWPVLKVHWLLSRRSN